MDPRARVLTAYAFPIFAFAATGGVYLTRQLWFDEALTVLNFACLDSPSEIYRNYVIPNNHLLFTMLIHYWMKLPHCGFPLDVWLRIPSVLCAFGALAYLTRRFRSICGAVPLGLALTALAISPPFLNYATAVRGYMLGTLFTVLALGGAMDCAGSRRSWWPWARYSLFSLGAAAAVPSDLAGLAGVVLFATPLLGPVFWKNPRFYLLALIPPAMLAAVYLPIFPQFAAAMALGEGWSDRMASLGCFYAAAACVFAMLLLPAAFGMLNAAFQFRRSRISAARLLVWLLPIPAAFLFKAAPFPRVYFPLLPLFALLIARALRDLTPLTGIPKSNVVRLWNTSLLLLTVLWGIGPMRSSGVRAEISHRLGGGSGDDFIYGYYLRPEHMPLQTADRLIDLEAKTVYFSFLSDPWAIMFYHLTRGGSAEYRFDGPRGRISDLPDGAAAVLRIDEDPVEVERRFGIRLRRAAEFPSCSVFVAEKL